MINILRHVKFNLWCVLMTHFFTYSSIKSYFHFKHSMRSSEKNQDPGRRLDKKTSSLIIAFMICIKDLQWGCLENQITRKFSLKWGKKAVYCKSKKILFFYILYCSHILFKPVFHSQGFKDNQSLMLLSPDLLLKAHLPAAYLWSCWRLLVTHTLIITT